MTAFAGDGRRLDQPLPLSGNFPVGDSISDGFLPSTLVFPTAGCWEVTATVGEETLTFVTSVQRSDVDVAANPPTPIVPDPAECPVPPRSDNNLRG